MLKMLQDIGKDWHRNVSTTNKYGNIIIREAYQGFGYNPKTKENVPTIRNRWFESTEEEMEEFQKVSHTREIATSQIFKRLTRKDVRKY